MCNVGVGHRRCVPKTRVSCSERRGLIMSVRKCRPIRVAIVFEPAGDVLWNIVDVVNGLCVIGIWRIVKFVVQRGVKSVCTMGYATSAVCGRTMDRLGIPSGGVS